MNSVDTEELDTNPDEIGGVSWQNKSGNKLERSIEKKNKPPTMFLKDVESNLDKEYTSYRSRFNYPANPAFQHASQCGSSKQKN